MCLILAAIGGIVLAAGVLDGGGDKALSLGQERQARREAAQERRRERAAAKQDGAGGQSGSGSAQATPAPSSPSGSSPTALDDQGFALMQQARYKEAVPVLQRAVSGFPAGTSDLGYAYALYNLGRSLGSPDAPRTRFPTWSSA